MRALQMGDRKNGKHDAIQALFAYTIHSQLAPILLIHFENRKINATTTKPPAIFGMLRIFTVNLFEFQFHMGSLRLTTSTDLFFLFVSSWNTHVCRSCNLDEEKKYMPDYPLIQFICLSVLARKK